MDWAPQPKQLDYLRDQADEAFYGGAAGGGKSDALLAFAIARRVKYPGSVGLILRRTLPELEMGRGLIPRSHELLSGVAEWSERKKRWIFPNGSVQEFGFCEREADVYRYQGGEYADLEFDELTHFTNFQYNYLRTRCRTTIPGCSPLMRSASNPGNVGHSWVKKTFVDKAPAGGNWTDEVKDLHTGKVYNISRSYIPAKLEDNKYLGDDYIKQLLALPDQRLVNALLNGLWDAFEGQFFTEFDPVVHVMERVAEPEWERMIAADYGYGSPFCALFAAIDPMGRIYIYDEIYQSGVLAEDQAKMILAKKEHGRRYTEKADPSIRNRHGDTGRSIEEAYNSVGWYPYHASNDRKAGWVALRTCLKKLIRGRDYPEGIPLLTIHPRCENLRRTLPEMIYAKNDPEDLDTKAEDHAVDTARYLVADYRYREVIERSEVVEQFDIGAWIKLNARRGAARRTLADSVRGRCVNY